MRAYHTTSVSACSRLGHSEWGTGLTTAVCSCPSLVPISSLYAGVTELQVGWLQLWSSGLSLPTAHLQSSVSCASVDCVATGDSWCCRKNGKHLGTAFRNITNVPLFPTIGLHR